MKLKQMTESERLEIGSRNLEREQVGLEDGNSITGMATLIGSFSFISSAGMKFVG